MPDILSPILQSVAGRHQDCRGHKADQQVTEGPLRRLCDEPALRPLRSLASLGRPTGQGWGAIITPMAALGTQSTLAAPSARWTLGLLIGQCTCGASSLRLLDRLDLGGAVRFNTAQ